MAEILPFLVIGALVFVFLSRRGNKRGYGPDADGKGCRDCEACIRPGYQRVAINATWGLIREPFVFFMSTCPQCSHVTSKHGKRDDGSFLD